MITRSDLEVKGDGKKVAIRHFDELGRVRLARAIEDIASEDPTNEEDGIKVQTRYKYDDGANPASSNGVYSLSSNPYRATKSSLASNEETMGWTVSYAPKDGKYSTSESFSGASLPAPFGSNSASTGIVRTDIDANRTLVTDQAGKQRISKTNALGQLTDIWEIKASDSDTEAISFPSDSSITHAYKTSYSYDTLNNLTTVNQGQQSRTFTYNSLSRLKSATNPESGTISYIYDENGNLTSKTDARNITTTYLYDNINRVKTRSYNDGVTSTVNYTYDNKTNAIGQLTKVSNGISTTEYQVFDKVGRVTQSQQTTDGETYNPMTYKYNLSGAMIEQTYPSGRKVKTVLDNDGMLSMIQSKKNANSGYWNYANSFTYSETGAVESMQLGNGKWESTTFNSRLQPTQIALGTVQNGTDKLKLDYTYGTANNNGNVQSQTITVERSNQSPLVFNQSYVYDELNRLKSAEETSNSSTTWKQTYNFDRYGNRTFDTTGNNTTTLGQNFNPNISNPSADESNNRFTTSQGYVYDLNGNLIEDASGRTFIYDGDNKQTEAKNSSSQSLGKYFFDGEGKRVKKETPTETIIFIYDASSKLVAEYSTSPSQTPKVQYLTEDTLGTPRIVTNKDGDIISRSDYMPYGEEIIAYGNRNSSDNYIANDIKQGFTGYEKDNETGLDYAQARMYNNQLGRFTGTDPIMMKKDRQSDPQRINLYIYARNNPLKYVDLDGMDIKLLDVKAQQRLLSTLPISIRKKVLKQIGKNGVLKRNSLDKIKSTNANFLDLKAMVNHKKRVFVKTASKDHEGKEFFYEKYTKEQQIAEEKAANATPLKDEEGNVIENAPIDPSSFSDIINKTDGRTHIDKKGDIIVTIADGTGKTSNAPESEFADATSHELFVHAYFAQRGKPWEHEVEGKDKVPVPAGPNAPVNQKSVDVRNRTKLMYNQQ